MGRKNLDVTVISKSYEIEFDQGRHWRGKVGFVLLATEQTVADDVYKICPERVGVHFARVASRRSQWIQAFEFVHHSYATISVALGKVCIAVADTAPILKGSGYHCRYLGHCSDRAVGETFSNRRAFSPIESGVISR